VRNSARAFLGLVLALITGPGSGGLDRRTASADGSVPTFAVDAQHTANFAPDAQDLTTILWSATIDRHPTGGAAHYGAPLLTAANTVLAPVKTLTDGFEVDAFHAAGGALKYALPSDYILPSHNWIPTYQPVLAAGPSGQRLYYPGAGGTVFFIENPDSNSPSAPVRRVFYTSLANYLANAPAFNSTVFINTPLTADAGGNVFFGFRVEGTAPPPLNTTQSGFARLDPDGNGTYVLAGAAAADAEVTRDSHSSAPALSHDESTLYLVAKSGATDAYAYLLGLDAATLATKFRVFLKDPRNGGAHNAVVTDDSTASPTVAPEGDVYFGVEGNPFNGGRGFLLRFSSDLSVEKPPGSFGWDYTAAIVPHPMVSAYDGNAIYLIFAKYNNYAEVGPDSGDGVNKIALLDPNRTQVDSHPSSGGMLVMREVLTMAGPTPDDEHSDIPQAVREWCINTAAVNPSTKSVFVTSEDGRIYRWNLATNSLSQTLVLSPGIGEPYVPTVIGPDGVVYALNGGTLFALGWSSGIRISLVSSSSPDDRRPVVGESLTFIATVVDASPGPPPPGNVTFTDTVYFVAGPGDLQSTTTVLGVVPLENGYASVTTSALAAGSHFIAATFGSGAGTRVATLVQRIHSIPLAAQPPAKPDLEFRIPG
jgi:Big-like domain-containing protein